MRKNKKGESKIDLMTILIAVGIILLVMGSRGTTTTTTQSSSNTGSGEKSNMQGNTPNNNVPDANTFRVVGAPCTQGTSLSMSVLRKYTDVAQGSENVTVFQGGSLRATVAQGGTTNIQSGPNGDIIDLFPAAQSTSFYTRHLKGTVSECKASATTGDTAFDEVPVANDVGDSVVLGAPILLDADGKSIDTFPNKVWQMDTAGNSNWFAIVNDGQANQNTGGQGQSTGSNLTIGSGGSGSVTITFRPGFNQAIGPKGNVLACQFPQAVYDSVAPLQVTYQGIKLAETPTKPSTQNYPLTASNSTVRAFAFPGVDGRVTPSAIISIVIKADQNHNPAGNVDRINCTIFDSNYYQRQRDGKYVIDIENRDTNANLGLGGTGVANPDPSFEIGVA